ncbi:MAG: hypothetical protein LC670_06110 [Flavobacteriales bacterium]|nr:hypothetical protein [Flavobacteriales bacterium]
MKKTSCCGRLLLRDVEGEPNSKSPPFVAEIYRVKTGYHILIRHQYLVFVRQTFDFGQRNSREE